MTTDSLTRPTSTLTTSSAARLPIAGWLLRQQRRAITGWSIALAIICTIYASFYPAIDGADMAEMLGSLPEGLSEALGYDTIGTAAGFLDSTVYSLLAPALLLVFAIGFGARVLAGQEEDGTLELEITLPVDRPRVLLERFLVLAAQLAWFAAIVFTVVTSLVAVLDMDVTVANIGAATIGLLLFVLAMGTVALAVGAATGRKAMGLAAGAGLAVAAFMADALSALIEGAEWLAAISPFAWYAGHDPLTNGIDWAGYTGLLAIVTIALATALPVFTRRDLGV